jgi:lipid II:glycine glycyltransferase (peptidoglycan interpeptide bridge formation enzyme)
MDSDYRRCTRNAEKNGVTVEESSDLDFAVDYYDQLRDVFAKQKLVPTYSLERVSSLLTHLRSTGMLLALRARDSADRCIATGIFLGHNDTAFFWGGASWRDAQILRPNHAIQWYAIRYWRARNVEKYDMGGGGRYKANFGGRRISVPWLRISKYPIFEHPRQIYKSLWKSGQRILGRTLTKA